MDSKALVTVVIPVFNGDRFLGDTLQSVFDQAHRPIEVIVIDDGSTDDSLSVAATFPDVIVHSVPHAGESAARNHGLSRATAELITFIDADDQMTHDGLAAQVAYLTSRPEVNCVFGHLTVNLEAGASRPDWLQVPVGHKDPVPMASALFRTELLREAGGFNESRSYGEWFELLTRLGDHGLEVGVIDQPVLHYRIHAHNQSHQRDQVQRGMFRSLKDRLDRQRSHDVGDG